MTLTAHTPLFRYDLKEPPKEWSNSFYEYQYECFGNKNKLGAYFFYENIENCDSTCKNDPNFHGEYYLTKCETVRDASLLSLCFDKMIRMLDVLYNKDIDVFSSDIRIFSKDKVRPLLDKAEEFYEYIELVDKENKTNTECIRVLNLVNSITEYIEPHYGNQSFGYLGQLLTDFENGPIFKDLLEQKGYEGYIFYENAHGAPNVKTYCIFDQSLLSSPSCEIKSLV